MKKILIAEDNDKIAMLEKDYLEINGYSVDIVQDGNLVVKKVLEGFYDLLILDIMLPNNDGYEICREIRNKIDIPILMVTAKNESIDKIRGLGLGADDYISKPFDPLELVARVNSHINRYNRFKNLVTSRTMTPEESITIGDIKIMTQNWKVLKKGEELKLSNREFEILRFLAENPNLVFSKEQIFLKIWGCEYTSDNSTVTVHINRIREKIEDDSSNPKLIETIWGAGYRLNLK